MSHNIITECPACTTRFQVTEGQLKIASGKVRCGACLEVFNAEVYRCDDLEGPVEQLEQLSQQHKDPLFDEIEVPPFTPPIKPEEGFDKRYSADPDIQPWQQQNEAENAAENEADWSFSEATDALQPNPNDLVTDPLNLEQPVSQLLKTADHSEQPEQISLIATEAELFQSTSPDSAEPLQSEPESLQEPEAETDNDSLSSDHSLPLKRPDSETESKTTQPFTPFRAEPVMIRTTRDQSGWKLGWTILTLLAIMLLISEYLWFNRQQLNSYTELSPVYKLACQYLPCHLQAPISLELIITKKLIVREHPEYQGALNVSLLMENRADFAQPYPAILLSFSDRLGNLISQRIFQPTDYLDSTRHNRMQMPAGQPVQVHFDILDPGRRALSYEVSLKIPQGLRQ